MPLSPQHAKHKGTNWSDVFKQKAHDKSTTEVLLKINNNNDTVLNTASLFHAVETLQDSFALVIPGPGKTIRTLHHCFSDLQRERVVGVFGLRTYSPFKEAAADSIVQPLQPPTTRESNNTIVPSFLDFLGIEKAEELTNKQFAGGPDNISTLKERPAGIWISGKHLTNFYGRSSRAGSVAEQIIRHIPKDLDDETRLPWEEMYLDQLRFLWAVEKGFLPTITLKDPPDLDSVQGVIEETNGLLHTHNLETQDPNNNTEKPPPDPTPNPDETNETGRANAGGESSKKKKKKKKKRRRKRKGHHSDSSSSSSESSTSSEDDSDGDRSQNHARSLSRRNHRDRSRSQARWDQSRSPRRRSSRSPGCHRSRSHDHRRPSPSEDERRRHRHPQQDEPLMEAFIKGMTALTQSQLASTEREKRKNSVLNRLSKPQAFLFDALSARNWYDEKPTRSAEANMILEDRDIERNWNLLVDLTSKWPGGISKPAFVQFLTKGFVSEERPGGFTAFMFQPPRKYAQGKKDRKRNLRNVLGKTGEVDEDDLEFYAKNDFYIPKSVYEGEVQIQMAIRLLDLFTNRQSIASDGYRYGLEFMSERQNTFHDEQGKDDLFMSRYINLLDSAFQNFAGKVQELHRDRDPIYNARHKLRGLMERNIERVMQNIDFDVMPNLPLPPRLQEHNRPTTSANKKPKGREKTREANKTENEDGESTEQPTWWTKNPSVHEGWALPAGKLFKDFFDTTEARGRANLARLPRAKHHNSAVRLRRNICARYQVEGECKKSCNLAHVPKGPPHKPLPSAKPRFKATPPGLETAEPHSAGFPSPTQSPQSSGPHSRSGRGDNHPSHRRQPARSQDPYSTEPLLMTPVMKAGRRRSPTPSPPPDRRKRHPRTEPTPALKGSKRPKTHSGANTSTAQLPRPQDLQKVDAEAPSEPQRSRHEREALRRNRTRLDDRNSTDETTMSKYLPQSVRQILGPPIEGPDDSFEPPPWLLDAVQSVADSPCPTPSPPPVQFSTDQVDLTTNAQILKSHDNDLEPLLRSAKGTTMDPSAEFRPIHQLARIFHQHPNFPFVKDIITNGMDYIVHHNLTEPQRVLELRTNLRRGNHKSASENPDHLVRLLARDVKFGFALPLPTSSIINLKGAMVQPAELANQFALQPDGTRAKKQRLTHDLSYSATLPDASINSRIDMSAYPNMIYGWCLLRIIHFIVALRSKHPRTSILIAKYDFSDAYRRIAHTANAAAKTVLVLNDVAYVMLRLAFGGSPNPPAWCAFSEMVTDLSNELPLCPDWDPTTTFSPAQPNLPTPKRQDPSAPFGRAAAMAVHIPTTATAKADCFIDDIVQVLLDTPQNTARQPPAVPLAVHLSNRPHSGPSEPMPRRTNLSEPKLLAEGTPAELQTVLGWDLATRELTVCLPQDKFIAWSVDVAEIIRTRRTTFHELESCIGRLNHAAFLIPLSRHFIPRLQRRLLPRQHKLQQLTLSQDELADLELWLQFLCWARQGISMNLVTHRCPNMIVISDSCPFGLGGFLWSGQAWRLKIPPDSIIYGDHTANNALEMLAMVLTIWLAVIDDPAPHRCILGLGDNTSAIGWLFRSSFMTSTSVYGKVVPMMARKLALVLLEAQQTLFSQHLPGAINTVADILSFSHQIRDGQPNPLAADEQDDNTLTQRFHRRMPQRATLLRYARSANHGIVHASASEAAFESKDRTWRRWLSFCQETGVHHPLLDNLPDAARELVIRSFFSCLRTATWSQSGELSRVHTSRVSATTVRNAASNLAAAFRVRFRQSPVHIANSSQLLPSLRALFKAYDNLDPPPQRQKAVTPRFLRALRQLGVSSTLQPNAYDHAIDIIIGAFFFAMRSCEYCVPTKPGRTKTIRLRHLCFRDSDHNILPLDHPRLDHTAVFITVTFEDQKSGIKMDSRSQRRTQDPILCPCKCLGRAVMRVVQTIPNWSPDTLLCALQGTKSLSYINNTFTKRLLRHACKIYGGQETFGFHPKEIGNRSIRSGAAMALFLKDHSTAKIMILGRWSSDAFLVYIRPQVLEWANNMSSDMVSFDSFLDVGLFDHVSPDNPRTRRRTHTLNGSGVTIPDKAFNLHH